MAQDIRLWKIGTNDSLQEIRQNKLDLEKRLEAWLLKDISMISDDLLVIGEQIETDFGGIIDILCLDSNGDVVILELKRDKTPREITAQVLDYASWVKDLSNDKITEIADKHCGQDSSLESKFRQKFETELPEIINEHHKMLIVASKVDDSSERIIQYLSDTYGVDINAITFQYFRNENGEEFLGRVFLVEPSAVTYKNRTKSPTKRKPPLTYEQLQDIAGKNGVGDLYRFCVEELSKRFNYTTTTLSTISFIGIIEESKQTILNIYPKDSTKDKGLFLKVYIDRFSEFFQIDRKNARKVFPASMNETEAWKGGPLSLKGYLQKNDVENLLENWRKIS